MEEYTIESEGNRRPAMRGEGRRMRESCKEDKKVKSPAGPRTGLQEVWILAPAVSSV